MEEEIVPKAVELAMYIVGSAAVIGSITYRIYKEISYDKNSIFSKSAYSDSDRVSNEDMISPTKEPDEFVDPLSSIDDVFR